MASPVQTPPPEPPADAQASPPPYSSQDPAAHPTLQSPDNPIPPSPPNPAAPTTSAAPPSHRTGDSSPPSPPSPPETPTPPPMSTNDSSPPLSRENQKSAPSPPAHPAPTPTPPTYPPLSPENQTSAPLPRPHPAPTPTPPTSPPLSTDNQTSAPLPPPHPATPAPAPPLHPAPASSETKSDEEEDESDGESGNKALALVLTQTEEARPPTPPKASAAVAEFPGESPQKESALTIAKLLSGEEPAVAEVKPAADKVKPAVTTESISAAGGRGGGVGSKRWLLGLGGVPEKVRRSKLRRAELGFRVSAAVFCLVSLSVMATSTTPGWSGDSFRRYNEYRYTLAASVMAFTYSTFQLVAEVHYLVTGRRIIRGPWCNYFNLAMDQVLAYLLLSASSAALSRNDVWVSRFGVDQFAKLINASASMAFLAFIALGLSSIISAHHVFSSLC